MTMRNSTLVAAVSPFKFVLSPAINFLADAFPGVRGDAFPGGETESEEAGELLPASGGGRLGRGHGDGELAAAL